MGGVKIRTGTKQQVDDWETGLETARHKWALQHERLEINWGPAL